MSKPIHRGPWRLRFLTVNKEADVVSFLTSNGVDKVVKVEPVHQPYKQRWIAVPVEGKKNTYRIGQDLVSLVDLGLAVDIENNASDKVILSEQPGEWYLEYVPILGADVYKIHPVINKVGVKLLLGKKGDEAVIQSFPITEGPGFLEPAWEFSFDE